MWINHDRIQRLLSMMSEKYSALLTQTITGMVQQNPSQRKRCSEVYQMLFPYENEILELDPFSLPTKVSNIPQVSNYQQQQNPHYGHQSYALPNTNQNMSSGYRMASSNYNQQIGSHVYQNVPQVQSSHNRGY